MNLADIAALAKAGFTKADIARLAEAATKAAGETSPIGVDTRDAVMSEKPPEWLTDFMNRFEAVEKLVQTSNLATNTRPGQPVDDVDSILGGLITGATGLADKEVTNNGVG